MAEKQWLRIKNDIEEKYNVKIIYSCCVGSRAFGIETADSDYDIRFIYAHPKDWYISLGENSNDTINTTYENSDENLKLDIEGWDIKKFLNLIIKNNLSAFEWLNSHIIYNTTYHIKVLKAISNQFYSRKKAYYHCIGFSKGYYSKIRNEFVVSVKKYIHTIRNILTAYYILNYEEQPPLKLQELNDGIEPQIKDIINNLIEMKTNGIKTIPKNDQLNEWINTFLNKDCNLPNKQKSSIDLNDLFRNIVN